MSFFKQACRIHLDLVLHRYLMSNASGSASGAEKAIRHRELCSFYVGVVRGVDPDHVGRLYDNDYKAVHRKTQELTDNLDDIGFPLNSTPDYDELVPVFFERFHALALEALGVSPEQH